MANDHAARRSSAGISHFSSDDELPHRPSPDPLWQESTWLYWGDGRDQGGCVHIGQEVPRRIGNVWASAYRADVAFRQLREDYPLNPEDRRAGRHVAGPYAMWVEGGKTHIAVDSPELSLAFLFEDYLPYPTLLPLFPHSGDPALRTWGTHYQTPGRVTGDIRIGDLAFEVDAFAQRGHSWEARDHVELRGLGSRWTTGSFGPDLSYSIVSGIKLDGTIVRTGFVVDRGTVSYTRDIDVTVEVDVDAITYRSGTVVMTMDDGRRYAFHSEFDNVNLYGHHGIHLVVAGGRLRTPDRTGGYCAWEIKYRPILPGEEVAFSLGAMLENGVHVTG